MPFDGITIRALCHELNSDLADARIDKISQPEKDEIVLSIRTLKSGTRRLMISANSRWARIHMDSNKKANPSTPPAFCMLLRKYLEGGKIKAVKQLDFERIVHISIEALDDFREWKSKVLICEFMGRHSNIILVNPENNLIIDAIKKYGNDVSSYREVLPGKEYVRPPLQDKLNPLASTYDDFVSHMWKHENDIALAGSLFHTYSGISPFSSRELCVAAGLNPDMPVEQCGEYEFTRTFAYIQNLLGDAAQGIVYPVVVYDRFQPVEFAPYAITQISSSAAISRCNSINEACDHFYTDKLKMIRLDSIKVNLSRNIKLILDKAYKKRFFQEGDLSKAHENLSYRQWGELLTAYAYKFQKGDKSALLDDFYSGEPVEIMLDPRYTPIQNAQRYFKIYNKSQSTIKHLHNLMAANQEEIDYLESVLVLIKQAQSPEEVDEIMEELEKEGYVKGHKRNQGKQKQKSEPRKFISSDNLEIIVGKNNRQNDILTLKQAERHDLWLHTREIPGTHVIVRLPKKTASIHEVPDRTLEEAAGLAAYFSKAGQSDKVPVDYTFRANVRKPGGAKPGMVIYENFWTIMATPHSQAVKQLLDASGYYI